MAEIVPVSQWMLDRIVEIEREAFSASWSKAGFQAELENKDSVFYAAIRGESVVGFCVLRCLGEEGELFNIAVSPALRGQGIGGALLDHVLMEGARRGVKTVFLEVRKGNVAAQRLYLSRGFQPVGTRKNYYDEPTEDAVLMQCRIEPA